jgi:hypothetical protein
MNMFKIAIITHRDGWQRSAFTDFYPLIRFRGNLAKDQISIKFFRSHDHPRLADYPIIILDFRYYYKLINLTRTYPDKHFIREAIARYRDNGSKVILWDNSDSSGCREFDLINDVDRLVKKQLLKDRLLYTVNRGSRNYMCWLPENTSSPSDEDYPLCPPHALSKLRLGWNIGLGDLRFFPYRRFLWATARFPERLYPYTFNGKPDSPRDLAVAFRGTVSSNPSYGAQRNKTINVLSKLKLHNCIRGGKTDRLNYLRELTRAKLAPSPFGWGEICYRDFEIIAAGSLLVKPDTSHLETYPNIFLDQETYLKVRWDMDDLEDILLQWEGRDADRQAIAQRAQQTYRKALDNYEALRDNFIAAIN